MLVNDAMAQRLDADRDRPADGARVRLPRRLKPDTVGVRIGMMQRLAASRAFALGDRSGVLRAAQNRSGRPFRLDTRQRVIVKALVSRHRGKGMERAGALLAHVAYLGRPGAGVEGERPVFFDRGVAAPTAREVVADWGEDRHHFRFIVSPEHGDRIRDLRAYVRDVMGRVSKDLDEPLTWVAVSHFDTDQPHAHVLVRGRRQDGRDLVIPRDYIGYGFRARAQEAAQERLGDLSRGEAERRVWRETEADRFTPLDRRLIASADTDGRVPDGVGETDAWAALMRGRLLRLEALGLATRAHRSYRLAPDMEVRLRSLQIRKDIIRTLNQRRMEGVRDIRMMADARVRGTVIQTGFHDELGAQKYLILRDGQGVEHYGRLAVSGPAVRLGQTVVLEPGGGGLMRLITGRAAGLGDQAL